MGNRFEQFATENRFQQPIVLGAPDPTIASREQRAANADARAAAADARAAEAAARAAANQAKANAIAEGRLQLDREKAALDAKYKEEEAKAKKEKEATGGIPTERIARLQALVTQINRVDELYRQIIAPEPYSILSSMGDYLPTGENKRFDSAAASLADKGLAAFRIPGVGAQSDRDAMMFERANMPFASDMDPAIEEKLQGLRSRVEEEYAAFGLPSPFEKPEAKRDAAPATQNNGATPWDGPSAQMEQLAQDETFSTPEDRKFAAVFGAAFKRGASLGELSSIAKEYGFSGSHPSWASAVAYRDKTGRTDSPISVPQSGRRNVARQGLADFAASPLGTTGINMADAASFGYLDEIAGTVNAGIKGTDRAEEIARADLGKSLVSAENPGAALTGQLLGGVTSGFGVNSAIGRLAPKLGQVLSGARGLKGGVVAAGEGAAYGSAYGSGQNNQDRLSGAIGGAALGAGGGLAGRAIIGGGGRALTGVTDSAVNALRSRGINMTPGQIMGGAAKGLEDRLSGYPVIGDLINARRTAGFEDFNRAAFDDALSGINRQTDAIGPEGVEQGFARVNEGYGDALNGVNIRPDAAFARGMQGAAQRGANARTYGQDFKAIMNEELAPIAGSSARMDGNQLQDLLRTTQGYGRQYGRLAETGSNGVPAPAARPVARAFNDMADELEKLVNRKAPDVMPKYNAAKGAYRNIKILQDAVRAAKGGSRTGEVNVFAPSQLTAVAEANAKKFGGTQGTTRVPFQGLTEPAQRILPSAVPDSGTAGRLLAGAFAPSVAGGVGYGTGMIDAQTALMIASLGAPYTKMGAKSFQALTTGARPAAVKKAGTALRKNSRLGGIFGASLALPVVQN